ncbi:MAG: NADH-quinone oxidoreductase subunit NuoF [Candidatus Bathyarchaeia archaeon]
MDKCCDKCTHSIDTPCADFILCRTRGPMPWCHQSPRCAEERRKAIDLLLYGEGNRKISLGMGTCGQASGAREVYKAIVEEVAKLGLRSSIIQTGCMGMCYAEPLLELSEKGYPNALYANMKPESVPKILRDYFFERDVSGAFALRFKTGVTKGEEAIPLFEELPFNKGSIRIVTKKCGLVDPSSIESYIAYGGYLGLTKALRKMSPEQVIEEMKASGLRGRGGAGFPTHLKWMICRQAIGDKKYMVCNADEGDPGAFMNRMLAEGDPHSILEGMIIAAYAIGASEGYIFVRAEKPLMAERFRKAVEQAKKFGLLGKNILKSGFSFDVTVILSAGAFVCGEETAMISTIEGGRAMPRVRPPFPATKGLFGKPTTINNVETLAHVVRIIQDGASEFAKVGSERSKGTKVFCLTGKVVRTGAVEVPLGTPIRKLIFEIGGGIQGGKRFKAIQTGGPSGGCLSEKFLDLPLDYETLQSAGSIMGSGGLVAMDEEACAVDVARYFLTFTTAESCGKCSPCRIGLRLMLDILTRITSGEGREEDLDRLVELSNTIRDTSLCALGQGAPNPVLTTLNYFRDEYEAHVKEKRCPAGVCTKLLNFSIDQEACKGCGLCYRSCPSSAIQQIGGTRKYAIDASKCLRCGLCFTLCSFGAIRKG